MKEKEVKKELLREQLTEMVSKGISKAVIDKHKLLSLTDIESDEKEEYLNEYSDDLYKIIAFSLGFLFIGIVIGMIIIKTGLL